jgi:hypothetical protein
VETNGLVWKVCHFEKTALVLPIKVVARNFELLLGPFGDKAPQWPPAVVGGWVVHLRSPTLVHLPSGTAP